MLLDRDGMWNDAVNQYVSQTVKSCRACRATPHPQPSRKVSISSLFKKFDDAVCVDHLYIDLLHQLHVMDNTTRFSAAYIVADAYLSSTFPAFERF